MTIEVTMASQRRRLAFGLAIGLCMLTSLGAASAQSLLPTFTCQPPTASTTSNVEPTWIDPSLVEVGLLQTPNFPRPFHLPLDCLWVFNLTALPHDQYLYIYLTQVSH